VSAALRVEHLVVELGGSRIVDDVSLSVELGQWVSVVGPNGAGKTTLLHAVAGVVRPTAGRIDVLGHDARTIGVRGRARSIALVPQTPIVPAGVSVLDYALLGRTAHLPFFGTETAVDVNRASEMLAWLGISDLASRRLETLSGGERQRAFLVRALLQEAPVVLLDEPTTALDIGHQQEVLELVDRLRAERRLAVVSTMHDLTLAGLYADELVMLDDGRVAERGPATEVLTEARLHRHFGARVTVLEGVDGPVVVPYRLVKEPTAAKGVDA
jgi:iron complex transport system ATP-binding protein